MVVEQCSKTPEPDRHQVGGRVCVEQHVSDDPDRAWARIAPHALHESNSYGRWLAAAGNAGPYAEVADADALRASGNYVVMTPDECVEFACTEGSLTLHPLMGGLDPADAAESLSLVESVVLPRLGETVRAGNP